MNKRHWQSNGLLQQNLKT